MAKTQLQIFTESMTGALFTVILLIVTVSYFGVFYAGSESVTSQDDGYESILDRLVTCEDTTPVDTVFTVQQVSTQDMFYYAKAVFGFQYCQCMGDPAMGLMQQAQLHRGPLKVPQYDLAEELEIKLLQVNSSVTSNVAFVLEKFQNTGPDRDTTYDEMLGVLQQYLGGTPTERMAKMNQQGGLPERRNEYDPAKYGFDYLDVLEVFANRFEQHLQTNYGNSEINPWTHLSSGEPQSLLGNYYETNAVFYHNMDDFGLKGFRTTSKELYDWEMTDQGVSNIDNYRMENKLRNMFGSPRYMWDLFEEFLQAKNLGQHKSTGVRRYGYLLSIENSTDRNGQIASMKEQFKCYLHDQIQEARAYGDQQRLKQYSMFVLEDGDYYCPGSAYPSGTNTHGASPVEETQPTSQPPVEDTYQPIQQPIETQPTQDERQNTYPSTTKQTIYTTQPITIQPQNRTVQPTTINSTTKSYSTYDSQNTKLKSVFSSFFD